MHYFGLLVHESGQVTPLFGAEVLEVAVSKFFECCLGAGYKPIDVHLRLIKSASAKFPAEICLDKTLLVSVYNHRRWKTINNLMRSLGLRLGKGDDILGFPSA